ncbi:hypothetical protein BG004_003333 [Podila humilis]|nr:hypothetical protein BG004_003333 [Podila humilis]
MAIMIQKIHHLVPVQQPLLVLLLLLLVIATTLTPVYARPAPASSISLGLAASLGQKGGKVYHWELDNLPGSLPELTKPLHLVKALKPGKSGFDIAKDPISTKSSKKTKRDDGLAATAMNWLLEKRQQVSGKKRGENILRSLYPAKSYSHSGDPHSSFVSTPLPAQAFSGADPRYIRLEYQMLFQPGFKWVKGGKLPGILSGSEEGCNAGCSGGGTAENCFSTRMMWRANGEGELYLYAAKSVYFPKEKPPGNCKRRMDRVSSSEAVFGDDDTDAMTSDPDQGWLDADRIPRDDEGVEALDENEQVASVTSNNHTLRSSLQKRASLGASCLKGMKITTSPGSKIICNPTYGISIGRGGGFKFRSGHWHNITQVVRANSKGKAVKDGYLVVYLDGKVVVRAENIVLLKNGYDSKKGGVHNQVKFMFSSFFGGGSADYATPVAQWVGWKDFKMSSSPGNIWERR